MTDYINQNFDHHIITVEDPIEFYHTHKKSTINQREIGADAANFFNDGAINCATTSRRSASAATFFTPRASTCRLVSPILDMPWARSP